MADEDLDSLPTHELYERAISHAKHHLDVKFFWELLKVLPAAEAGAGEIQDADADLFQLSAHLDDLTDAGKGETAEILRPFYLDYLRRHQH
jgi:hypothetical protein